MLGVYRKNSTTAASSENMAFILKCNFTSSSTDNNRLFCCNNGWPLLYPFGQPVWNNWLAGKVTGNLKRQREKAVGSDCPAQQIVSRQRGLLVGTMSTNIRTYKNTHKVIIHSPLCLSDSTGMPEFLFGNDIL